MKRIVLKDVNVWKHEKHSPGTKEEITMEITKCLKLNDNKSNTCQNQRDTVLRE